MVHGIADVKLWRMPVSETGAMSLSVVVLLNAFNAFSFLPKAQELLEKILLMLPV